jgi:hypothetical protein
MLLCSLFVGEFMWAGLSCSVILVIGSKKFCLSVLFLLGFFSVFSCFICKFLRDYLDFLMG